MKQHNKGGNSGGNSTGKNAPSHKIGHQQRCWIAENLLLGVSPAALVDVLASTGFNRNEAIIEVDAALKSPYLQGATRLQNRLDKREWIINISARLNRVQPIEIVRREKLSGQEFLAQYYSTNRPVIITGMLDNWPALHKWGCDYFRQTLAGREVEVQFGREADGDYEKNSIAHKRKMAFGEYIDRVERGPSNDFYMTANNDSANRAALSELWQDILPLPEYLNPHAPGAGFLWFGPAGTITPLHHDLTNNFMAQVIGRKKIKLISVAETARLYNSRHCFSEIDLGQPDLARFPAFQGVPVAECILQPGEILFLPVGWWHYVEGLDLSVTMAFTNFRWDNDFYSHYPKGHDF
jgi:hypothetical protein